jgi:hypothetical protein
MRIDKTVPKLSAINHMVEVLYGFHLTHYRKHKKCLLSGSAFCHDNFSKNVPHNMQA